VWQVTTPVPAALEQAIVSHLRHNCRFAFEGAYKLFAEQVSFYENASLCMLCLEPGTTLNSGRRRRQRIERLTAFYFLFRDIDGDEILLPLTGGEGDIVLANRWLGLVLHDDAQRLDYARFYCAFARTKQPPAFHNVPRKLSELRFKSRVTEQQIWGIYGATWRFLVNPTTLDIRIAFEPRGLHWLARHRAHLPMQCGSDLLDVDLKIWAWDGHVSYRKSQIIYRDEALDAEPQERPGRIGLPVYVRWRERLLALFRNVRAQVYRGVYLVSTAMFLVASFISLIFPLGAQVAIQPLLEILAVATGWGDWTIWLRAACLYCLGYFVFTTLLVLDIEKVRNALLAMSSRFQGSRLDALLYGLVLRGHRTPGGYRRDLFRRVFWAVTRLMTWTFYLVLVFTSLQISFRPQLANEAKTLLDVMRVFGEQALLYIPVVFYYVGRKSLEPERLVLVASEIMIAFQLIMGLLVIRRVHRFWASTSAARLRA
jgi:hypothetical protein